MRRVTANPPKILMAAMNIPRAARTVIGTEDEPICIRMGQDIHDLADDDGWAFMGDVGSLLQKKQPNFDSRNYGFAKLTPLINSIGKFEIDQRDSFKGKFKLIYVRNKKR